jgi:glycosyltransferase involved in cell wall biosynthesis
MKILHLATQDRGGGGADAAYRLHRNMRSAGMDSRMLVLRKLSDDSSVVDISSRLTVADRWRRIHHEVRRRYLRRRFRASRYFYVDSAGMVPAAQLLSRFPFQPDAIIAHWISGFADAGTLRAISQLSRTPVLWYLLDMGPLTGGCHYTFGCPGFLQQCGNCPQLAGGRGENDLSRRQWRRRMLALQDADITAVAGSSWLRSQLEVASLFHNQRHETILLGVDVDTFRPVPQNEARARLGLPADRTIVFFGASSLHEERKGIRYLLQSLTLLHAMLDDDASLRERILVVTAGKMANATELDVAFEHRHIGFLEGDDSLSAAYQAADVFVSPSVEDAGPMMINEALLCGTPVVSFDMGVAADLVHSGQTGYRATLRDARDMAEGLRRVLELSDEASNAMRARCRILGLQLCHPRVQIDAFASLCEELTQPSRSEK